MVLVVVFCIFAFCYLGVAKKFTSLPFCVGIAFIAVAIIVVVVLVLGSKVTTFFLIVNTFS